MEKPKKKNNQLSSPLREPKAKKTLGLKVPSIQMPHLELVKPEPQDIIEVEKQKATLSRSHLINSRAKFRKWHDAKN